MDTINTNGAVSGFSASNSTGYYKIHAQCEFAVDDSNLRLSIGIAQNGKLIKAKEY